VLNWTPRAHSVVDTDVGALVKVGSKSLLRVNIALKLRSSDGSENILVLTWGQNIIFMPMSVSSKK
jgi:hypothetical protein